MQRATAVQSENRMQGIWCAEICIVIALKVLKFQSFGVRCTAGSETMPGSRWVQADDRSLPNYMNICMQV